MSKKDVKIVEKILSKNDIKVVEMKECYLKEGLYVLNFMSFFGSGKIMMLENLVDFKDFKFCVVEGDL